MARRQAAPRRRRPRASKTFGAQVAQAFEATRAVLEQERAAWALIGGLAVSARTVPRFTADVDFVVACEAHEVEGLVHVFVSRGFALSALLENKVTGNIATVRLKPPRTETIVDLLFQLTGNEAEIAASATELDVAPGVTSRVASVAHLIAMKVLAARDKDREDLGNLLRVASASDLAAAKRALAQIQKAGRAPGRKLVGELARLLAPAPRRPRRR